MLKVAAYCRVSTDHEDQANSLENQSSFFKRFIERNPDWELSQIYVDDGITGTNTKHRKAFQTMLTDANKKEFDLLLTKEISRFARNTLDSIQYTRQLKNMGIGVVFINDNINTLDPDSELRLTIMASIAQEESRKTSSRVKWGITRMMEAGFVWGNGTYGYFLQHGTLSINEEQANIVKLIFDMYNHSKGTLKISKTLESMGVVSPTGLHKWSRKSILSILKNEKYAGILKQKKEVVIDFLTHEKVKNDGTIEDYIIIPNHHQPIIDPDLFELTQKEIAKRAAMRAHNGNYSNLYVFSGKIYCGLCGSTFHRRHWNQSKSKNTIVWQCKENIYHGKKKPSPYSSNETLGCDNKGIHESFLIEAFLSTAQSIFINREHVIATIKGIVEESIESAFQQNEDELTAISKDISKLESKKLKLLELFMEGDLSKLEFKENNMILGKQLESLVKRQTELSYLLDDTREVRQRLNNINGFIDSLANFQEFGDDVCKEVLNKIVVYSRNQIDFFLSNNDTDFFIPVVLPQHGPPIRRGLRSLDSVGPWPE